MNDSRLRVAYSLVGAQVPANSNRGIGRYIREHVGALRQIPTIELQEVLDPSLPILASTYASAATSTKSLTENPPRIVQVSAAIENLPLTKINPGHNLDNPYLTSVLIYDLIPLRDPDRYFQGPLRRLYRSRMEWVRSADLVLAISESTRNDLITFLDMDPERVVNIEGGCSTEFTPADHSSKQQFMARLNTTLPELNADFIYFAGNIDPRKNVEGMLHAYSQTSQDFRSRHQLVITASQSNSEYSQHLLDCCMRLEIGDTTIIAEYVDEATLLLLYQLAWIFIFPSFFEGLGLPIIEAQCCGTAVLCSDTSSMRPLNSNDFGLVNPYSPTAIADRIQLLDERPELIKSMRATARSDGLRFSWKRTAELTAQAWLKTISECG